jgi:serine/threonine protein kinase
MPYKTGDTIGKYKITTDFSTANAGQSLWGFGEYGGREFFIKKFLNPVYPGAAAPLTKTTRQKRIERCLKFEAKQQALQKALSGYGDGGLVVKTVDFFKHGNNCGSHYFKVCQKIDTASIPPTHLLTKEQCLFIMLTAAFAVSLLHSGNIIHFDIKPENILIHKYGRRAVAKIIDFDNSLLTGEELDPDSFVGDQVYYSPEFAVFLETNGLSSLPRNKSDIFSLGLVFSVYWTGKIPGFKEDDRYPYQLALNGEILSIRDERELSENWLDKKINKMIDDMLLLSPEERPSAQEVHQILKNTIKELISDDTQSKKFDLNQPDLPTIMPPAELAEKQTTDPSSRKEGRIYINLGDKKEKKI